MTARILVGTCSWTDRTLIESGAFYPREVSTQGSPAIYESIHAFHIFDRKRLLEKAVYWEFGLADPMLYVVEGPEQAFMDVDTEHDFTVLSAYLKAVAG